MNPLRNLPFDPRLALVSLLAAPAAAQQVDTSRMVFLGDSLSAGFQNGSLHEAYQPNGFASLIAGRAGAPLPLPLIAAPGIPNTLVLLDPGPPPVIGQAPGLSGGRIDVLSQTTDLAVPGHRVQDALTTRPDLGFDDLTDLVLGLPGLLQGVSRSQVEWAEALQPSVAFVWLGNNDALVAALFADASLVTPAEQFAASFIEVVDRLQATGARLVLANVPDVATIPYLTSGSELSQLLGLPIEVLQAALGLGPCDFVIPDAFPLIEAILTGQVAGPLPPQVVLDAGEVAAVRAVTTSYNAVIAQEAADRGAVFVDVHAFLEQLDTKGVVLGGQRLGTGFLGGIFSLDGVHPTDTGYALVANEFIHALNAQAGAGIPPVDVLHVMKQDPLVLPGVGHPPASPKAMAGPAAQALREVLGG